MIFNKKNHEKKLGIFEFIPDETFEGNVKQVNAANFKSKKFSGMIVLRNLNDTKVNGFIVKNGNIIRKLVPTKGQSNRNPNQLEVRGCMEIVHYYNCGTVSFGWGGGFLGATEPQCSSETIVICWDDDGGSGGSGGTDGGTDGGSGGGTGGDDECSWCDDISDNWSFEDSDSGAAVVEEFIVVARPCTTSLVQGFTTGGVFPTLYQGSASNGSTLNNQWLRTTEGNFIDVEVPTTRTDAIGRVTPDPVYLGAFSLNVSGAQPAIGGITPNRLTTPTPFTPTELNTISTLASNSYVAALNGFSRGDRVTNTGNRSLDFLSLWAQLFDASTPFYRMNAESGDLNASTSRGTPVSSCP